MKTLADINRGRRMANRKPRRQVNIIVQRMDDKEWSVKIVEDGFPKWLPDFDTRQAARDIADHLAVLYRNCACVDVVLDLSGKH